MLAAVFLVPKIVFGTSQGLRKHVLSERSARVPGSMKQTWYRNVRGAERSSLLGQG